jgi:hypothetical protein
MDERERVWVFSGESSRFPSAVFRSRDAAEPWIRSHRVSGVLTAYPLDVGVYDWAVVSGFFTPKSDEQRSPNFIQRFSSAYQEHYHYDEGRPAGDRQLAAVGTTQKQTR